MHYQGIDGYVYNVLENEKIAGGGEANDLCDTGQ